MILFPHAPLQDNLPACPVSCLDGRQMLAPYCFPPAHSSPELSKTISDVLEKKAMPWRITLKFTNAHIHDNSLSKHTHYFSLPATFTQWGKTPYVLTSSILYRNPPPPPDWLVTWSDLTWPDQTPPPKTVNCPNYRIHLYIYVHAEVDDWFKWATSRWKNLGGNVSLCSGPWKPGSWCRLGKVHNLVGETLGCWEFGVGKEWGGNGEGDVSLQATWDQGGRDRITPKEGFQVSKGEWKGG